MSQPGKRFLLLVFVVVAGALAIVAIHRQHQAQSTGAARGCSRRGARTDPRTMKLDRMADADEIAPGDALAREGAESLGAGDRDPATEAYLLGLAIHAGLVLTSLDKAILHRAEERILTAAEDRGTMAQRTISRAGHK